VFAGIHLEDISSQSELDGDQVEGAKPGESGAAGPDVHIDQGGALLGKKQPRRKKEVDEAQQRSKICMQILQDVGPILSKWGITLHNFQLESTKLADLSYANEYEKASLAMAKAKADCRTQAQTAIRTRIEAEAASMKKRIETEADATAIRIKAAVDAEALKIKAEAEAKAKIKAAEADANSQLLVAEANAKAKRVEAQAAADAKRAEGKARGDAADLMANPFSQQLALREQQVAAVNALKVNNLNVLSTAAAGSPSWVEQLLPVSISAQMVRNAPALRAP
jgi:regulator of protease activity HflC (stomatin/prohibitin superfamily)